MVRGKEVIGSIYEITADVINSIFSLILIFGTRLHYNQLPFGATHISPSTISLGLLLILVVLARITFFPR